MGGFAASHHAALAELEARGLCRVVATCDPHPGAFTVRDGVEVFPSLDAMLVVAPDVVTLPTPIPLHAEQHAAVVAAEAACYLEKPPSLWWPEYVAMATRDEGARVPTQVGFNFVGDPFRQALKRRILDGEFGPLQEVTFLGLWPRERAYYTRNDWAGRLRTGGHPVFDSPFGNAMAHYVQNLLFWGGEPVAKVETVRAWLARAHLIESCDTGFVAARLAGGVILRLGVTHAGTETADRETLVLRDARVTFPNWRTARIDGADGRTEILESDVRDQGEMLRRNFEEYFAVVRGERPAPTTSLAESASFVRLCGLAFASSEIRTLTSDSADEAGRVTVKGLNDRLRRFVESGDWPTDEPREVSGPL